MVAIRAYLVEIRSTRDYWLLISLAGLTFVEAITYAWIEVLLYTSDSPVLYDTWLLGHYTTYHLALVTLVVVMIFGAGIVGSMIYSKKRFKMFIFLAIGNFILWTMLEDEFTFVFSGSHHTLTDWTNWPLGAVSVRGFLVPDWYFLVSIATALFWYLGLRESS